MESSFLLNNLTVCHVAKLDLKLKIGKAIVTVITMNCNAQLLTEL